jgi:DNA-binding transcriptional regulator YiaG
MSTDRERRHDAIATATAVRYLRCDVLGMSRAELARRLGVSVSRVENWERGLVAQLSDEMVDNLKRVVRAHRASQERGERRPAA